ncbi:MarR family winged helix-turn-helix transcriptional regulator [Pseudodesulfovibrio senegalensis]|uniref:MarR family transcriptional regulator n=1 Tax=Pseudodesulfovibrio senegalensis TaxID=1721087 RepID=A0A6N6N5N0_9BACT|nr:MarR family transcriptional regulator [Pseudodesulfovibrio senegalensis]KAB1443193.1 MarR family transcriptional regulator [Pseudodesulfovibrio senegalensis]
MKSTPFENPQDSQELVSLFRHASRLMARADHACPRDGRGWRGRGAPQAHHAQGRVLAIIHDKGPISQGELLEMLDIRSSSLSELLGKLQSKGLIERERNEADRRSFTIRATALADELMQAQGDADGDVSRLMFSLLDPEEREILHGLLLKVVRSMQGSLDCRGVGPQGRGPGRRNDRENGPRRRGSGPGRRRR